MSEGTSKKTITIAGLSLDSPAMVMVAAHELKAPLALLRQLSLSIEAGGLSASDVERVARQMTLTSERALRLTGDMTRTAQRDSALFKLEPVNPVSLCEEVAKELMPLFAAHNKSIRVRYRRSSPLAVAHRELLRRVLINFSDNALHYSADMKPVELSVQVTGSTVRIGVRDYGPAIAADVWRTLSSRLKQGAMQPLAARPQSSGLGLSIASQFAEMMQGTIGVTRHRDGATFYVEIQQSRQMSLL
ncbi:TPA: sensor histidine kinase [Candidatus Saccharibacteria bacterium]|nr:MAG: putative Histidine kinase [Candidatus Saccharibacteria bacterium GW2011_GWC2_44_17]OGL34149.1 MAG: hypothetical protein A3E20_04580 [Candidatus Saccharibacteria bacterium RIFCSPHIGHO2_12_FULL_47_16]HBH78045.1 sensor histidine kinase [Candidatus Saccharibacteria bacterium]